MNLAEAADTAEVNSRADAGAITRAIAARVKALVKAQPNPLASDGERRMLQRDLATAAYPDMVPASALRRLQRLMTGELELRPRDAAALSRALGCSWRAFYTEAEGGPSVMGADST